MGMNSSSSGRQNLAKQGRKQKRFTFLCQEYSVKSVQKFNILRSKAHDSLVNAALKLSEKHLQIPGYTRFVIGAEEFRPVQRNTVLHYFGSDPSSQSHLRGKKRKTLGSGNRKHGSDEERKQTNSRNVKNTEIRSKNVDGNFSKVCQRMIPVHQPEKRIKDAKGETELNTKLIDDFFDLN
eukprot:CAMPEP_0185268496 /NCGR_PEP_ID=MMETSP1359-20130426/37179_1 /TAXON_ID=552665 /ORGANISM="Bigelowiella longifila, Strain CCMP242" /LENGTH=179 /DNA_ID=CAMNT_0027859271 /DNA_START=131 /DNA_END=670 /DNA_ORIENTATION=+